MKFHLVPVQKKIIKRVQTIYHEILLNVSLITAPVGFYIKNLSIGLILHAVSDSVKINAYLFFFFELFFVDFPIWVICK